MKWIEIISEKDLPPKGKYVLARHNIGTWLDSTDQENVNCVVVKLVYGITEEERMKIKGTDRSRVYKFGDVFGNNLVPYAWTTFGPSKFFGQDITHWAFIEPID